MPVIYYYTSSTWKPCKVFYYTNGEWIQCTPFYYTNGEWKTLATYQEVEE